MFMNAKDLKAAQQKRFAAQDEEYLNNVRKQIVAAIKYLAHEKEKMTNNTYITIIEPIRHQKESNS